MKPAKSPAMPLYGKDIFTDVPTISLPWAAQFVYIRLLWWQWSEGFIPDDVSAIAVVLGRERELRKLWPQVRPFFAAIGGARLQNEKLEEIRAEMVRLREKRAGSGSKGGSKTAANRAATGQANDEANAPPAVAVASPVPEGKEVPSRKSRSRRSNTSDGDNGNGWSPLWSEKQFQFKADKIAKWVKDRAKLGVLPETDDFDTEFAAEWGMSYARWAEVRPAHEAFFSAAHRREEVHA